MNVKHKVQKVGANGGSPAQGSQFVSGLGGNSREMNNAIARANWRALIYDRAQKEFCSNPVPLFSAVWRYLRFVNCPVSYPKALSVYNNAIQELSAIHGRDLQNSRKANNQ